MNREDLQEIEGMISGLPEWEQEARRIVYSYTYDTDNFPSVYAFLATKLPVKWGDTRHDIGTIADYYEYIQPFAVQLHGELDATFEIDFIGAVNDSLAEARGDDRYGSLDNLLDQGEQVME